MSARVDETDDERRARRLAKKAAKRAKEAAAMGGYANEANPWNDPNLTEHFVWGKKVERDRKIHGEVALLANKRHRADQLRELEKAKSARVERELQREAWEAEKSLLEREREQMAFEDNEKREETFQMQQTHLRAKIRTGEGRGKPIDLLSESVSLLHDDVDPVSARDIKAQDPIIMIEALTRRELHELLEDVGRCVQLDAAHSGFWVAIRLLCEHQQSGMDAVAAGSGLTACVSADVSQMLSDKTVAELDELCDQITDQLQDDEAVDTDYWRTVQQQLNLARARRVVRDTHGRISARKAELVALISPDDALASASTSTAVTALVGSVTGSVPSIPATGRYSPTLMDEEVAPETLTYPPSGDTAAESGRFSPPLLLAHHVATVRVTSDAEDWRMLQQERERIQHHVGAFAGAAMGLNDGASGTVESTSAGIAGSEGEFGQEDALLDAEARRGMEHGEARFSFEVPLERKITWWHDKYRPRKPKYFNRVHTGYEWNKYNQTHYDHDNPPPKMVQGYKFAIFYPDLIDRTQPPTYALLPDPSGERDTCLIRFRGGPPYEDIAFKIVNNEWEYSHSMLISLPHFLAGMHPCARTYSVARIPVDTCARTFS